jgi:hypothetical protein
MATREAMPGQRVGQDRVRSGRLVSISRRLQPAPERIAQAARPRGRLPRRHETAQCQARPDQAQTQDDGDDPGLRRLEAEPLASGDDEQRDEGEHDENIEPTQETQQPG